MAITESDIGLMIWEHQGYSEGAMEGRGVGMETDLHLVEPGVQAVRGQGFTVTCDSFLPD